MSEKTKSYNSIGKGALYVGAAVPKAVYNELLKLSKAHGFYKNPNSNGVSTYARLVLIEAALSGALVAKVERVKVSRKNGFERPRELVEGEINPASEIDWRELVIALEAESHRVQQG